MDSLTKLSGISVLPFFFFLFESSPLVIASLSRSVGGNHDQVNNSSLMSLLQNPKSSSTSLRGNHTLTPTCFIPTGCISHFPFLSPKILYNPFFLCLPNLLYDSHHASFVYAHILLDRLSQRKLLSSPLVLRSLVEVSDDPEVLPHVFSRMSMHYKALSVKDRMERSGVVTYNSLIHGFGRKGRIREVTRLFREIKGVAMTNNVTYTTLIDGCCIINDIEEALRLQDVMEAIRFSPGVVTYNLILSKLYEVGRIREANWLLTKMNGRKIEPDNIICNTLINARQNWVHGICSEELENVKEKLFSMLEKGLSTVCDLAENTQSSLFRTQSTSLHATKPSTSIIPPSQPRGMQGSDIPSNAMNACTSVGPTSSMGDMSPPICNYTLPNPSHSTCPSHEYFHPPILIISFSTTLLQHVSHIHLEGRVIYSSRNTWRISTIKFWYDNWIPYSQPRPPDGMIIKSKRSFFPFIVQRAIIEFNVWNSIQKLSYSTGVPTSLIMSMAPSSSSRFACLTDVSWYVQDSYFGLGWVLKENNGHEILQDSKSIYNTPVLKHIRGNTQLSHEADALAKESRLRRIPLIISWTN